MALRVVLGLVLAAMFASPAQAAFGPNLLTNGDAEAGPGATDSTTKVPVPGWTTTGDFTVMQYGTPGFADSPDGGASNMFVGGPSASDSTATQVVDVSGNAEPIDDNARRVTLMALLGGFAGQEDQGLVEAHFRGGGHTELGRFSIGPVTAGDRRDQTGLLPRSRSHAVPSGTRSIVVVMVASKASGVYNDGYIDNVVLRMDAVSSRQAHWTFGFRIAHVAMELSFGSHGSFTTRGQPNAQGELRVHSVSAAPFTLRWRYGGHRFHMSLRFVPGGTYAPRTHELTMALRLTGTNVPSCRPDGEITFVQDQVGLRACSGVEWFKVPKNATYHVGPL